MNARFLSLALVAAGLVGVGAPFIYSTATAASAYTAPDPALQIKDLARKFRAGDVAGLAEGLIPPQKWELAKLGYELQRMQPTTEEQRAEFAEKFDRIVAPDAVDLLMEEIEPKLVEARLQAPGALLMAFGAMQMAVASPDTDLTDAQRAALQSALPGIQQWASTTDFLDSETMRQGLTLLTDAARRTGIDDIDQLKALPLEGVLDRASGVLVAAKQAVRLYGIDLDAVADSLQVEVLEIDGENARVRTTVTLFNAPIWAEHNLVLVDGRWYGEHLARDFHVSHTHDSDG